MRFFLLLMLFSLTTTAQRLVRIQPLGDVPPSYTEYVYKGVKKVYPNVTILAPCKMPKEAYYYPRKRYKADKLLSFLGASGERTLGITTHDISTSIHGYSDWGVMGLSNCPGNASVVSTYRLNKGNLLEQLLKVCLHELGHSEGLPHCKNTTCLMADAKGKNPTDQEKDFCGTCKKFLLLKGWKL